MLGFGTLLESSPTIVMGLLAVIVLLVFIFDRASLPRIFIDFLLIAVTTFVGVTIALEQSRIDRRWERAETSIIALEFLAQQIDTERRSIDKMMSETNFRTYKDALRSYDKSTENIMGIGGASVISTNDLLIFDQDILFFMKEEAGNYFSLIQEGRVNIQKFVEACSENCFDGTKTGPLRRKHLATLGQIIDILKEAKARASIELTTNG